MLAPEELTILVRITAALAIGAMIGFERTFHGRPAGFRTHALVCVASALLMLVTVYQDVWMTHVPTEAIRTDPTRMAQGIMTGIGFLGAGVIFKEGLSVRGLTTAASIWITAAIGILLGIGFYLPAVLATLITVATLSIFRWIESRIPSHSYAHHFVRFDRDNVMPEQELKDYLENLGFKVANMSHRLSDDGLHFEYRMVIWTTNPQNLSELASALRELKAVRAFRISPTGD